MPVLRTPTAANRVRRPTAAGASRASRCAGSVVGLLVAAALWLVPPSTAAAQPLYAPHTSPPPGDVPEGYYDAGAYVTDAHPAPFYGEYPQGQFAPRQPAPRPLGAVPDPLDSYGPSPAEPFYPSGPPGNHYLPAMSWLGLRHSHSHGRHVGLGGPHTGTSWLNRPFYAGGEIGTLWMLRGVDESVGRDVDTFGGVFAGWDWDHYWGSEFRFNRATPELINANVPDAPRNDRLMMWTYSLMYYPWGDSAIRPYWRFGVGNTKIDFPLDSGARHDEWLLTLPVGVGIKYPLRRWLAARTELTDQISLGSNGIPTQHNLTLTFGLEWHFGARPRSYWPWHPSRKIW